jgi:hypothetical protein
MFGTRARLPGTADLLEKELEEIETPKNDVDNRYYAVQWKGLIARMHCKSPGETSGYQCRIIERNSREIEEKL